MNVRNWQSRDVAPVGGAAGGLDLPWNLQISRAPTTEAVAIAMMIRIQVIGMVPSRLVVTATVDGPVVLQLSATFPASTLKVYDVPAARPVTL